MILSQRTFAGGELDPALHARVDANKYETGLSRLRNFTIMKSGGVQNRAGTEFIYYFDGYIKLIPYRAPSDTDPSATKEFVLVITSSEGSVTPSYIYPVLDGEPVKLTASTITDVASGSPTTITTSGAHGLNPLDIVYLSGSSSYGMEELWQRYFIVGSRTATTFTITDFNGTAIDSSGFTPWVAGSEASSEEVYRFSSFFDTDETSLKHVQYSQQGSTLTICSFDSVTAGIYEIVRTSDTSWASAQAALAYGITAPANLAVSGVAGLVVFWRVSSVNAYGEESALATKVGADSLPTTAAGRAVSWDAVSGAVGYNLYKGYSNTSAVFGFMVYTPDTYYVDYGTEAVDYDRSPNITTTVVDPGSSLEGAVGHFQQRRFFGRNSVYPDRFVASRIGSYSNFYADKNFGAKGPISVFLIGRKGTPEIRHFVDFGRLLIFTNEGVHVCKGDESGKLTQNDVNPSQIAFHGASRVRPAVMGQSCMYVQDRTSVVRDLFTELTSDLYKGNDLTLYANHLFQGTTIREIAATEIPHPLLWVIQEDGSLLSLSYVKEQQIWGWARHDFQGCEVESMCVVPEGDEDVLYLSIVRTVDIGGVETEVRSLERMTTRAFTDAAQLRLLDASVTYELEQGPILSIGDDPQTNYMTLSSAALSITGITQASPGVVTIASHGLANGDVVRLASISGMTELNDTDYTVAGVTTNTFTLVDSDGDAVNTSAYTAYTSGGTATPWGYRAEVTVTASGGFSAHFGYGILVGDEIHFEASDGPVRVRITEITSTSVAKGHAHRTVPTELRSTASDDWAIATDTVTGLWHLEGQDVAVYADGSVVANPNNPSYETVTVEDGEVTLSQPYARITVGLPYTSDLETLDIDSPEAETVATKKKLITQVGVRMIDSRPVWVGQNPEPDEEQGSSLEGLREMKFPRGNTDGTTDLRTGIVTVNIRPEWNSNGRIFIRNIDPVPVTILAVHPDGMIPFGKVAK